MQSQACLWSVRVHTILQRASCFPDNLPCVLSELTFPFSTVQILTSSNLNRERLPCHGEYTGLPSGRHLDCWLSPHPTPCFVLFATYALLKDTVPPNDMTPSCVYPLPTSLQIQTFQVQFKPLKLCLLHLLMSSRYHFWETSLRT